MFLNKQLIMCLYYLLNFQYVHSHGEINVTCSVQGGIGICIPATECPKYKPYFQNTWLEPDIVDDINNNKCGSQGTKVCCSLPKVSPPITMRPIISNTVDSDGDVKASTSSAFTSLITKLYPDTKTTTTSQPPASSTASPHSSTKRSILSRIINVTEADDNELNSTNAMEETLAVINTLPVSPQCGYHTEFVLPKVVSGFPARLGYFPWMALLGYRVEGTTSPGWFCGGSIITARHILTAAHCIENQQEDLYVVRVGELDLDRDDDGTTPVDIPIKTKIVHPGYQKITNFNDIGILILAETINYTDFIGPICLPMNESFRQDTFVSFTPMVSGWGALEFRGPAASRLQGAMLPIISNKKCAELFSSKTNMVMDQTILCTYSDHKGSCQGDSGSPLALPWVIKSVPYFSFYQVGVVSSGGVCGVDPSVFTWVIHYIPWIEQIVTGTRL